MNCPYYQNYTIPVPSGEHPDRPPHPEPPIPWCNHPKHSPVTWPQAQAPGGRTLLQCKGNLEDCPIRPLVFAEE